ncbi:MAG TPA: hypothetical protein VMI56_02215 [Reyranella sp.]|nr:hypothetical protein [Reyranella sp.]
MKGIKLAIGIVLGLIVLGALGWLGLYLYRQIDPTEKALSEIRNAPLVGLALADHPEYEDRLRKAIRDEARDPTDNGPTKPMVVVSELRRNFIAPVIRGASDRSLINVMAARAELVRYLQKNDLPACREFSMGGIARVDLLDDEAQGLFKDVLKAMEVAYRSGRGQPAQPLVTPDQLRQMLAEVNFTKRDFDRLNAFGTLTNDLSCQLELRIDLAPPLLPIEERGPFSRFILAQ